MEESQKTDTFTSNPKILVIPPSRIGDAILASGLIHEILSRYKRKDIYVACPDLIQPLYQDMENVKGLIPFEKMAFRAHWLNLWRRVISKKWEHIIDLRGSAISYGLLASSRTIWRKMHPLDHKVIQLSRLLDRRKIYFPHIDISEERLKMAENLLNHKPTLVLAPSANWMGKQWPVEKFMEIAKRFHQSFPYAQIVVMAAPHERDSISALLDLPFVRDFTTGEYDLLTLAAIIQNSHLFLGNDSGLMHMSAAVGTKTIGLFGPTDSQVYGPWNQVVHQNRVIRTPESRAKITNRRNFSFQTTDISYMASLGVEKVWQAMEEDWKQTQVRIA